MEVTMYEFLGMIKDGKASDTATNFMLAGEKYNLFTFLDIYTLDINSLNWEVKIIEDIPKEEKKIPETLNYKKEYMTSSNAFLLQYCVDFLIKINEIIDYLDYLKSKGE